MQFADPFVADRAGDGIDRSVRAANATGVVQIEVLLDEYPIAGSGAGSYIVGVLLKKIADFDYGVGVHGRIRHGVMDFLCTSFRH